MPCRHPHTFSFNDPAPTEIYPLSLHDALPISSSSSSSAGASPAGSSTSPSIGGSSSRSSRSSSSGRGARGGSCLGLERSEEHTSELQSLTNLVCRLLLEKKNNRRYTRSRLKEA